MRGIVKNLWKKVVIVAIQIPIAALHFFMGSRYAGPFPAFVNGYLLDILIPFAFYFLLCVPNIRPLLLHRWYAKGLLVFAAATGAELAQYHGVYLFGSTFDPLDIVMFGTGVIIAAFLDTRVFPGVFPFWRTPHGGGV